jgi:hypothetical protein
MQTAERDSHPSVRLGAGRRRGDPLLVLRIVGYFGFIGAAAASPLFLR